MQVQPTRKRPPSRSKKNQARTINNQLHPRRRPSTPLKREPQTPQVKLRNHGGKRERKRDLGSGPAKNTQKEIIAPKPSSTEEEEGADTAPRRPPREERGVWPHHAWATTSTSHTTTTLGRHMKKKKKRKEKEEWMPRSG